MSSGSLVSVIMIFLDEEKFIPEAIASVLSQTYQNWELILVDDGSTDQSSTIAQNYAQQYSNISYLEHQNHQNLGMSASRNLGINNAQGEYITFLDGDDLWLPEKLEQQVAILDTQPDAALVCGRAKWWYGWTGDAEDQQRDFLQKLDVSLNTLVQPPTLLLLFLRDEWASLCDILVRKTAIEAVGGYEDDFPGMYEDQVFHAKLCLALTAFVSSECWYLYRQHNQACTIQTHTAQKYHDARQAFLIWLEQYLLQQPAENIEVWQFVQQNLWHYRHPLQSKIVARLHRLKKESQEVTKLLAKKILPENLRFWLKQQWLYQLRPPLGWVRWGSLRRLTPISRLWPNYRGIPIDRYYIEKFLGTYAQDVRGRVLELGDATYTYQFGGDRITQSFIMGKEAKPNPPENTIYGDLANAPHIPSDNFDTIILTQTLLFIYDLPAAIATLYRLLKPGGVLLVTVPGITPIIREDMERWGQYWSFTKQSAQKLLGDVFAVENINLETYGNVLSTTGFLYGLAVNELTISELDYHDPDYELIIGIRAVKPQEKR
jgi:glycosyltransferase involved in cell wall biosynthesis